MHRRALPLLLPLLCGFLIPVVLAGCGSDEPPFTDNSKDADLYAQDVKQIALDAVQRAKRSREPADQIQTLVSELESQQSNNRPVGPHQPVYSEMLNLAKEFISESKTGGGKPANMGPRLDSIAKLAEKLPGQVQLGRK